MLINRNSNECTDTKIKQKMGFKNVNFQAGSGDKPPSQV